MLLLNSSYTLWHLNMTPLIDLNCDLLLNVSGWWSMQAPPSERIPQLDDVSRLHLNSVGKKYSYTISDPLLLTYYNIVIITVTSCSINSLPLHKRELLGNMVIFCMEDFYLKDQQNLQLLIFMFVHIYISSDWLVKTYYSLNTAEQRFLYRIDLRP